MKTTKLRVLALFLTLVMCFGMLPMSVWADESTPTTSEDPIKYGYYDDGEWSEGELKQDLPEGLVSVEKKAEKTGDNTYEITLEIVTEQTTTLSSDAAAVVLVIDTSGSMRFCAECGGETHTGSCKYRRPGNTGSTVLDTQRRLSAAKQVAKDFINSYKGDSGSGSPRYVAIVNFAERASSSDWFDVTTTQGLDSAISTINGLNARGGTNIQAGLRSANNKLNENIVKSFKNKDVVLLSDGAPTYSYAIDRWGNEYTDGNGSDGNSEHNQRTAAEATSLKKIASLYTVCFGAKNDYTYVEENFWSYTYGPTVGNFLRDSIATDSDHAYNADNTEGLAEAFEAIVEEITSGLTGEGAYVIDKDVDFVIVDKPEGVTEETDGFKWELSEAVEEVDGNVTQYHYTLTYTVTLDANNEDFKEETWYPLNGRTYLVINDDEIDFPIPAGKGVKSLYTVEFDLNCEDATGKPGNQTVKHGETATEPSQEPEREGWNFIGWTVDKEGNSDYDFETPVVDNITLFAQWEKGEFDYEIHHVEKDTDNVLAANTTGSAEYGDTIDVEDAILTIEGFTYDSNSGDIVISADKNEAYIYYSRNKYEVEYKFTSAENPDVTVPDSKTYAFEEDVEVHEGYEDIAVKDETGTYVVGTWSFDGWDREDFTMPAEDVEITGSWTYTEAEKYNVSYSFDGEKPDTVTAPITMSYEAGVPVEVHEGYEDIAVKDETDTYVVGTWSFGGWDREDFTMPAEDVEITGSWTYTEAGEYTVTYKFTGEVPAEAALPLTISRKPGQEVEVAEVSEVDGYSFSGWESEDVTITEGKFSMPDKNVTLTGRWEKLPPNTISIPISKIVEKNGNANPGKRIFEFELFDFGVSSMTEDDLSITGNTITTDGAGTYTTTLYISVDEEMFGNLTEGFSLREKDEADSNWDYSDAVYRIEPNFDGTCEIYDNTPVVSVFSTSEVSEEAAAESLTVASFTNIYTKNVPVDEDDDDDIYIPFVPKGNARLIKVDAADADATLSGARFNLYKSLDFGRSQLVGTFTTDEDGEIFVKRLIAGDYYWQETRAPEGYTLDDTKYSFRVVYDKTATVTAENEKTEVPPVFADDHYAYIIGYEDGLVRPQGKITRAEVATIFFRLLSDEVREENFTKENDFTDVKPTDWFNNAVSTMAKMGVIKGYPDGSFGPSENITRAEFAAIATRFETYGNTSEASFNDIYTHWATREISIAANNGWVLGYEDGSFRPDQSITRAEAMTMVNRVLRRIPETVSDLYPGMVEWADNMDTDMWYYLMVQEATNSHFYEIKDNGYENWTKLRSVRDWTELEK